jgi:hypothetical protein
LGPERAKKLSIGVHGFAENRENRQPLDRERDLERKRGNQKLTDDLLDLILFQHLRSAMSAAVATAAVTTAEASHVSAPAKAARMATAKRLVMPSAIVMVLPGMVVDENR